MISSIKSLFFSNWVSGSAVSLDKGDIRSFTVQSSGLSVFFTPFLLTAKDGCYKIWDKVTCVQSRDGRSGSSTPYLDQRCIVVVPGNNQCEPAGYVASMSLPRADWPSVGPNILVLYLNPSWGTGTSTSKNFYMRYQKNPDTTYTNSKSEEEMTPSTHSVYPASAGYVMKRIYHSSSKVAFYSFKSDNSEVWDNLNGANYNLPTTGVVIVSNEVVQYLE